VSGLDATTVCVGDRYAVVSADGVHRGFEMIVTQPRRPCGAVDQAHGKTHHAGGVRDCCATASLAGFFVRVEAAVGGSTTTTTSSGGSAAAVDSADDASWRPLGNIAVGDKLVLTSRSWPTWNLARISGALYGGWALIPYGRWYRSSEWSSAKVLLTNDEIAELVGMPELADDEWKDEV